MYLSLNIKKGLTLQLSYTMQWEAAKARNADLVIVDTAGRLHTKVNLMEELKRWAA